MSSLSHPHPSTQTQRRCPRPPRSLEPLEPPPVSRSLPALPSPQRSFLDASYVLTTHIIPAAFPRSTPDVPLPALPVSTADKQQRSAAVSNLADEIAAARYKQWDSELNAPGSRKPLWVCLNRYVRKRLRDGDNTGVTLFFAHANGLHKETWEPTISELICVHQTYHAAYEVDEIWTWEAVNHGDSYLLNSHNLSGMYDWRDNSRDMLHFLLHYLPCSVASSPHPTHLPRLADTISEGRKLHGLRSRTLVGVGHSFGGCTIARAALDEPNLFTSLILVDPIIRPHPSSGPFLRGGAHGLLVGAIKRQERWPSREDARRKFLASPFFAAWHPAVLELYIECALCNDHVGGVRLKMPPIHEALVFSEAMVPFETWDMIDMLDEHIGLRWIVPGKVRAEDEGVREQMVWRRPANSSNVVIPSATHLITQETPVELAREIHEFLQRKYGAGTARL